MEPYTAGSPPTDRLSYHIGSENGAVARMISSPASLCRFLWQPGVLSMSLFTLLAVFCGYYMLQQWPRQACKQAAKTFPFMELPPELRAEVLTYLLEPPIEAAKEHEFQPLRSRVSTYLFSFADDIAMRVHRLTGRIIAASDDNPIKRIARLFGVNWNSIGAALERHQQNKKLMQSPTYRHLTTMRLVSKAFGAEFFSTYLIHARPVFTLDASSPPLGDPFGIPKDYLPLVKNCTLRMIAKPGIVNAFDPRQASARDWTLRDAVFASMEQMTDLRNMTLTISACGNQLWNPVWLWHFTSQAFKESDVRAFKRIDFTMKEWNIRAPHHLARSANGRGWEWRCERGHLVMKDEEVQAVRAFSSSLYAKCRTCKRLHRLRSGGVVHNDDSDTSGDEWS
ncbi:uncharacterized protein PV09_04212 [Verruconis gallopava]|uniref:F-box domain-containing protein n=1 Tax=Verruconis gallopava TaxID=253628 RepID=A0A0D1YWL1_9PEZI|nr:uncharacterized protein PV09_04212 [Verruconis gallopava]KIW05057.1 hypothetical protein PV09_04212 [Verruconis gallopava]